MQYISPLKNKKDSSLKKKIAIVLIVISSIGYFALFTNLIGFLKYFLLGTFGVFAYPLFFGGYAISFMLFKDKQFVMPKKFIVYICLFAFSLLAIFHIAFSSYIPLTSYGAYLSETYNSLSVGGVLLSLITYPVVLAVQFFGAYVLFGILLVFSAYKLIDFFILNKNSSNYVKNEKRNKTRIEEVKISSSASNFLNEQIFRDDVESIPNVTIEAEIKSEEDKKKQALSKLGLSEIRNKPIVNNNKQLDTFEKVYNAPKIDPIFDNEEVDEDKLNQNISNFNPFNSSSFNGNKQQQKGKNNKKENLDFLRATLDPTYKSNTTEEIAQMKKRNLNLKDNLKNLPINDYLSTNNDEIEEKPEANEKKPDGSKISDVKIDDLINKVKTMEKQQEKVEPEIKKYAQTNLLDKPAPTKATYQKPIKYIRPTTDLLNNISTDVNKYCEDYEEKALTIEHTLENFKVPAKVVGVTCGPSVTRFELEMPAGISVNKIHQFSDDISYALATNHDVRIEAPIPGKSAVGIEVPNKDIATVGLREVLESKEFYSSKGKLTFALGKDINGTCRVCDLAKMPHLLVAGSTGSGKSVCLNVLLVSLLYKCSPEELRLVLVDPKRVEFSMFNNLPHLLIPEVICNSDKAINALNYLIKEMERRYELLEELYVKKIDEYNETQEVVSGEREKLPYIVMVMDEMNDLMSSNKKEIEDRVVRITQKARAVGIHLILATQRPSVDVITGTIKANLPSRIAFAVTSIADSRTILDRMGAEKLLGKGDMLYFPIDLPEPSRIQCAFISNEELKNVITFIKQNNECVFSDEAEREINKTNSESDDFHSGYDPNELDSLFPQALKYAIEIKRISISNLQRTFSLGFSRAGKIIDQMARLQYIGPADGNKPRVVYLTMDEFRNIYGDI